MLADALGSTGVEVGFIHWKAQQEVQGLPPGPVGHWDGNGRGLECLIASQRADWIWIQLSPYGYSRWGAPYLLSRGLKKLRRRFPSLRLATYAHELYCEPHQLGWKGPLLSPWQAWTVGRILQQSDLVFTSTPEYRQRIIQRLRLPEKRVHMLPLGSNVPMAPLTPRDRASVRAELGWARDERVAVIFGSAALQTRTLERFADLLRQGFRQGVLQRIVAVGGLPGEIPADLRETANALRAAGPVDVLGYQSSSRIGSILPAADFGLLAYPRHLLRKSSVFSAYACAGLAVLSLDDVGNLMTTPDPLPILDAEHWRWDDAGTERVNGLRRSLRSLALEQWAWDSIAVQALACIEICIRGSGIPNPEHAESPVAQLPVAAYKD
jgi:hypothetical protein